MDDPSAPPAPEDSTIAAHLHPRFLPSSTDDSDDLPSYDSLDASEGPAAPAYISPENDDFYHRDEDLPGRALVFSMRQHSRKAQSFIHMGPPQTMLRGPEFTEVIFDLAVGHQDEQTPYPWNTTHREYLIEHKLGAGLSKNKPDMFITALNRESRRPSLPNPAPRRKSLFSSLNRTASPERTDQQQQQQQQRRGSTNSTSSTSPDQQTQHLATVRFARDGPLPWTPRARIVYDPSFIALFGHGGHQLGAQRDMEMQLARAQNHAWKLRMFGRRYSWQIRLRPARLVLIETEVNRARAEFVYSGMGSWAQKGAEVGRLRIPLQGMPRVEGEGEGEGEGEEVEVEQEGANGEGQARGGLPDGFMEYSLISLAVCVTHWKNECKYLVNVDPLSHWSGVGMGGQPMIAFGIMN